MTKKAITIKDLFYSYPGEDPCLRGISLSVDRGETFGLIGPNGAGKSTLLLHMNGLLKGEGRIEVFGKPLTKDTVRLIRKQIGIVFQDPNDQLFMPTVFDNVAFGPANMDLDRAEVEFRTRRMLEVMELSGYADRPVDNLSLGRKKRSPSQPSSSWNRISWPWTSRPQTSTPEREESSLNFSVRFRERRSSQPMIWTWSLISAQRLH